MWISFANLSFLMVIVFLAALLAGFAAGSKRYTQLQEQNAELAQELYTVRQQLSQTSTGGGGWFVLALLAIFGALILFATWA